MAIVINGSGTITGVSVGGLPDGSVDSDTLATGIDAIKLADGTVTSAELQYINTLASNAQTQITAAGGVTTASGTATFTTDSTGAQAVTGLGFQPSTVFFNAAAHNVVNRWSVGFSVGTDDRSFSAYAAGGTDKTYVSNGQLYTQFESPSSSAFWEGSMTSMDSDGFTWTKTNAYTPTTATISVHWLAFK